MRHYAVIGLGFGDEGKGSVVEFIIQKHLAEHHESEHKLMVVRHNGGQQAGHTVQKGKLKHTFSNFGSGTLSGVPTYWSQFCTVDPVGFMNEYNILKQKGIKPVVYMNANSPLTTPLDKVASQRGDYLYHSTCGTGYGTTLQREENHYHLKVNDFQYRFMFDEKYHVIEHYYQKEHNSLDVSHYTRLYKDFYSSLSEMMKIVTIVDDDFLQSRKTIGYSFIFEGSQGLLLDKVHGVFPYVTRSHTGLTNVKKLLTHEQFDSLETYVVTRSYATRHGNGPFLVENHFIKNPHEINQSNQFQGRFKTAYLDMSLINYALMCEPDIRARFNLVMTCVDIREKSMFSLITEPQQKPLKFHDEADFMYEFYNNLQWKPLSFYMNDSPDSSTIRISYYMKNKAVSCY